MSYVSSPEASKGHGLFVSLEGIEGSGKTTQYDLLVEALTRRGIDVIGTCEPGGTSLGQEIRAMLLNPANREMDHLTEALLYAADRCQHVNEVIMPALRRGQIVVCDRYIDSSLAYQGTARQIGLEGVKNLNEWATNDLYPDITFLLDLPAVLALGRLTATPDRIEAEPAAFHEKVRDAFIMLSKMYPGRFFIVDGTQDKDAIHRDIMARISQMI